MMRKLITLLFFSPFFIWAQKPFINNITPTHVEVGETVTIAGSNLSGTTDVFFGGVAASFTEISDNLLEATVPAGATNSSIYVINNGDIAQSSRRFFISFVGSDISSYDAEYTQTTGVQAASDLCMCDLDGNGKNDIVIVHNLQTTDDSQSEVTIYLNNTTGSAAFSGSDYVKDQTLNVSSNGSGFFSVACGDLDNDGFNDLAFSSNLGTNAADIFVLAGDGSGTFSATPTRTKSLLNTSVGDQRLPGSIEVADLDGDGLLDLVVGNRTDGTFHIFRNTGSFNFDDAVEITAQNESTGLLKVADFNNDGYQDIATLAFRQSNTSIHLFKNTSTLNNFNFQFQQTITNGGQTSDVEAGDFDNDGLLDLVVASRNSGNITTFENQSSGGSISFGSGSNLTTSGSSAFGVNLGDMNGDGLLDIVSSYAAGNVHVFENTTSGSISFGTEEIQSTSGSSTQNVVVGDLNGDAKPDIAYTRDVQVSETGNLGIILNRNCVTPVLSPAPGDGTFCSTPQTFTLSTTLSPGATYTWEIVGGSNTENITGGTPGTSSTTNTTTFDLQSATSTTIRVTIDEGDGTCNTNNDEQTYNISGTQTSPAPTIDGISGVACVGDAITLSSTSGGLPYDNYYWVRPDGTTSTSTEISLDPVSINDAGTYTLRVSDGSDCLSVETSIDLEVNEVPGFEILNNGGDDFCATSSILLEVPDFSTDYTYQWFLDGDPTGLGTSVTQTVSQSGDYTVEITEQAAPNCSYITSAYTVNAIAEPSSVVDGPSETCVGIETAFSAASTGQSGFTLTYAWQVDGSPVTPTDPTQLLATFNTTGAHTVTLTTAYDPAEVDACSDVQVFNVTVAADPSIAFDVTNNTRKCPSDTIPVSLTSPAAGTIDTYEWALTDVTTSDTIALGSSATFNAYTPQGVSGVRVISRITTDIGCQVQNTVDVLNFDNSNLQIDEGIDALTAGSDTTVNGIVYPLIELTDVNFIELNGSGGTNYGWTTDVGISDNFDNPNGETTTFFPSQPLTLVTLSGTDSNNCDETYTVAVYLDNFRPRKTFSPNGDGMNDCWEILNIGQLGTAAGCKVYVFDSRGRTISTKENFTAGDNCVWDGNFNGSSVPEGVYYFVMKCESTNTSKSGSILLAR